MTAATLAALLVAPAAFAAPVNDDFANRLTLQLNNLDERSNVGATIESSEPLTANDASGDGCTSTGARGTSGNKAATTLWWEFVGNGGPVTVSTLGSNFDTVVAVYESAGQAYLSCNDDIQAYDPAQPNLEYRLASEVVVNTIAGRQYAVQVGGCSPKPPCANDPPTGTIDVRASSTPTNDSRVGAISLDASTPKTVSNRGATTDPGEMLSCRRYDDRTASYARTVWFRYRVPAVGTLVASASGVDTVLAVYRGDDPQSLGCNDDGVDGVFGPSRLPMSQPPGPPVHVTPGDHYIQVGGYYDPGFNNVAARSGLVTAQVEFTEDLDQDSDGVDRERDCDDHNSAIHPGASELPNNDVDEDCDGVKAYDRDQDGALAPPAGADCRDDTAAIRPGAPEIAGNGIDDNCDGSDAPDLDRDRDGAIDVPYGSDCDPSNAGVRPGAVEVPANGIDEDCNGRDARLPKLAVTWTYDSYPSGISTVFTALTVRKVPNGTIFELRCTGRGCAKRTARRTVQRATSAVSLLPQLRRLGPAKRGKAAMLRAGIQIEIRVKRPGSIGLLRTYRIRRKRPPAVVERCLGAKGKQACPRGG